MRTSAFSVFAVLFGLCVSVALAAPAKPGPGKPAATAKAPAAADKEEVKLPGTVYKRPNGSYLSLDVVNTHFVLKFYDKDKHPVAPDATRASVRWQSKQKPRASSSVLLPSGDGRSLAGDKVVQPPFVFKVYGTLFSEGETVLETFQVDYRDDGRPPEES